MSGPAKEGERIAKRLARAGLCSRRDAERWIEAGRVKVDGVVLQTPAFVVTDQSRIEVDGKPLPEAERARLWRYHKPPGELVTARDPQGRRTIYDSLPKGMPRVVTVGRLDFMSEGLLLLTNDGGLARALELPETAILRRYRARAHGRITQEKLDTLKNGITVEGVRYGPIEARLDKAKEGPQGANVWISVTLTEGKNREVRRVLEALGLKVNRLIRLAYGPFALGTLGVGELEEVGPRVIREQLAAHIAPENLPRGDRPQWTPPKRPAGAARRAPKAPGEAASQTPAAESPKKKAYKPGWAKPKIKPKSPAGRRAGPAGPPRSASPRRTSGARPPAPRPGSGPGRRG